MHEFEFTSCFEIKELLGEKADDELKLMELLEVVPTDAIYYHMHSYFLRHHYLMEPYSNDFANWAAIQVRDKILGERLSSITPWKTSDINEVRLQIIDIIDSHLSETQSVPSVTFGKPFYFMKSRIIEIPSELKVSNLKDFTEAMKIVDASALYNHIFEARLREGRGKSDLAIWLEEQVGEGELAEKIEGIDAYMYSLEDLRKKIVNFCEARLNK